MPLDLDFYFLVRKSQEIRMCAKTVEHVYVKNKYNPTSRCAMQILHKRPANKNAISKIAFWAWLI